MIRTHCTYVEDDTLKKKYSRHVYVQFAVYVGSGRAK